MKKVSEAKIIRHFLDFWKHPVISSNINEVIRAVLNSLFYKKILHAQKAQKAPKAQKALKAQKNTKSTKNTKKKNTKSRKTPRQKNKNANKQLSDSSPLRCFSCA